MDTSELLTNLHSHMSHFCFVDLPLIILLLGSMCPLCLSGYMLGSWHIFSGAEKYLNQIAAVIGAIWVGCGLPRQVCMKIACALHSGEAAHQRFNVAGLVEFPALSWFYSSTGVVLPISLVNI